jgi:aspartate ammonia-lyase
MRAISDENFRSISEDDNQMSPCVNQDMEHVIMSLHNKMKNLESKYIDLANFYKKGLVTQRQNSIDKTPYGNANDGSTRYF